jgi:hypothetical protein
MKHSKYKNTGVLFELLTRQVTADVLNDLDESPALRIIKENFTKNSALKRELGLYNALLNETFKKEQKASYLVDVVLKERKKISANSLRNQKYNLIKEIKRHYSLRDFFKTKINDYKNLAAVSNLFEYSDSKNAAPEKLVRNRFTIIEHITRSSKGKNHASNQITEYTKQEKDLRLLSYKILIDKFNEKYDTALSAKQKRLLQEYINNITNISGVKSYVNSEIPKIKKSLITSGKYIKDKITKIKLNEVINQVGRISKSKKLKDNHVLSMMRIYELIKEVKNVKKI